MFATGCDQSPYQPVSMNDHLKVPRGDFNFESPVRIFAGGDPVSVREPGYAFPTMADVDGDGADDLVVGQFAKGNMKFYRNENEPGQTPKFAAGEWLKSGDEEIVVPGVS